MLETEEVDDDFITPIASTSLANIFGNVSKIDSTANDSLKYVPPKPENIIPKKKEPPKATECIFACALIGHEWCNNVYTSRGKLGFAIIKIQKTGDHNIVLYDANKTTLSTTTVSPQLEVTIKNNSYISYYDSLRKYWSIYGTDEEVKQIVEILKNLGANINYCTKTDKVPLQPSNFEIPKTNTILEESSEQNRGSDTDSSVNRKTKESILNRMANMGHSVLPSKSLPLERTSDSSDTNEIDVQPKIVRHKTVKTLLKRNNIENIVSEPQQLTEAHQRIIVANTEPDKNVTVYSHQNPYLSKTGVIANTSNEWSMFIAEQRIGNSELRINLNRVTDKVDAVLNKIESLQLKDKDSNVSTDIFLKLLAEYENKIKVYEELLKSNGPNEKNTSSDDLKLKENEIGILKNKISELETTRADQSNKIHKLEEELKHIEENHSHEREIQTSRENELLAKIISLQDRLEENSKQLTDLKTGVSSKTDLVDDKTQDRVKNIMNDTFQTISINFENSNTYTGDTVKRIVGTVIKKITINALSDFKQN